MPLALLSAKIVHFGFDLIKHRFFYLEKLEFSKLGCE